MSANMSSYVVGTCFGITIVTTISLAFIRGWRSYSGITSHRILYFVALSNCIYSQIKITQLNGEKGADCKTAENLSLIFYHGSNTIQLLFYILRYKEVFQRVSLLIIPSIITLIYTSSIPVAILLNQSTVKEDGVCFVNHPIISGYLPLVTNFLASTYMLCLFLTPFCSFLCKRERNKLCSIARASYNLLITNSIAIISNILFNLSLTTSLNTCAPMLSMIDLTLNFIMVCLPYFLSKFLKTPDELSITWSNEELGGNSISRPNPTYSSTGSHVLNFGDITFPSNTFQPSEDIHVKNEITVTTLYK
ncbi:hypothetical protein K7432_004770 [Basidiobolus ranarum]|uniref:Uncharacterized protein n=1 Tax=Basidiobolus ranarum TaxID=34480 RepID=A0ABR2W431_9FUNG